MFPQFQRFAVFSLIGETLTFDAHPAGVKFIQILNVRKCHWITVTSVGCNMNEVKVYDSLPACDVSFRTKQQIASLILSDDKRIKVVIPDVQQQTNNDVCLFFMCWSKSVRYHL